MNQLNNPGFEIWEQVKREVITEKIERQVISGDQLMMVKLFLKKGAFVGTHSHPNEQFTYILNGKILFRYGENLQYEASVGANEVLHIPANLPHNALCLEDAVDLDIFTPPRTDWATASGSQYLTGVSVT